MGMKSFLSKIIGGSEPAGEKSQFFSDATRGAFPVSSDITVNARTALDASVVLACASTIANGISQVPFRLYKQKGNVRVPATDHELYWLMEEGPNPYQSQFEFRESVALNLAMTGECFVFLIRVRGAIKEMYPFTGANITVQQDLNDPLGFALQYTLTTDSGRFFTIPASDMWHIRWRGFEPVRGTSPVVLAREAIGITLATDRYHGSSIKNGVKPSGILTANGTLTKEQQDDLKKAWKENYSGAKNASETIILSQDFKYQSMAMTNADAQFIENRDFEVAELCRYWNVMPIMVYSYTKTTTFASAEQLFLQHKVHTLDPWYRRIETSANKSLLSKEERREQGLYFKFIDDGLLRGDAKTRSETYRSGINNGYMTPNEVRALSDLNPIEGGDKLFMQGAMQTVENIINENPQGETNGNFDNRKQDESAPDEDTGDEGS